MARQQPPGPVARQHCVRDASPHCAAEAEVHSAVRAPGSEIFAAQLGAQLSRSGNVIRS